MTAVGTITPRPICSSTVMVQMLDKTDGGQMSTEVPFFRKLSEAEKNFDAGNKDQLAHAGQSTQSLVVPSKTHKAASTKKTTSKKIKYIYISICIHVCELQNL